MLTVEKLEKRYGDKQALAGVSFALETGQTLGLLGPNGAGKTTTVSIIAGLVSADAGRVLFDGQPLTGDADVKKRRMGLVPQDLALYEELSARDNLRFFGALYDLAGAALDRAIAGALELVQLGDRARDKVKTFSGGMKRRLNIAAALLHDPEILILDEPTVGVDPQSRSAIFDNLEELKRRGKSILYTTHYMEEAERLCDRIVIVDHGKVVADDTLRGLVARASSAESKKIVVELAAAPAGAPAAAADAPAWLDELRAVAGVQSVELAAGRLTIGVAELATAAPAALAWLGAHGYPFVHFETQRAGLEGIFLSLTGRELRDP